MHEDRRPDLLCDELPSRLFDAGLSVRVAGFEPPAATGLLLQVVDAEAFGSALRQLDGLRHAATPCTALIASIGLEGTRIDALLDAGASDFFALPCNAEELIVRMHRALGSREARLACGIAARHEARAPSALTLPATTAGPAHPALRELIGDSPAFAAQVARVPLLAKYDAGVLILGDTGTGKEVCARAIHYLSARAGRPWVALNCGAIPAELIEAELFGHARGAFTHAHCARAGLVREAEGGTLFLDEIDALPYVAQSALLRFLQDKEYRAVGSNTLLHADVRVIAATNTDPALLVARGRLRQDLLFRLNVLTLHLPRLRERQADIPQLALHFLRAAARQWDKAVPVLSAPALRKLLAHDWPGNVRELKNVVERALLMGASSAIGAQDIDFDGSSSAAIEVADESFRAAKARVVEGFERSYIEHLLACNAGNVTHAARAAKKNRRAFFELMRKYRIEPDPFRDER